MSLSGCDGKPEPQATPSAFSALPARRATYLYAGADIGPDRDPLGKGDRIGILLLDDMDPDLVPPAPPKLMANARAVHEYAGAADRYFRQLQAKGFGSWDGWYGKDAQAAVMTSVIYPDFTGFQGYAYSETFIKEGDITPTAVAHEWAHGVVERTTHIAADNHETAAIWESLSDVFAMLSVYDPQTPQYAVFDVSGVRRSLADPRSVDGHVDDMSDIYEVGDLNVIKYQNAGIPNKAAYLLLKSIGDAKVEQIYFHALSTKYMTPPAISLSQFAHAIASSCRDSIGWHNDNGISESDCLEVERAFAAVGLPPGAVEQPIVKGRQLAAAGEHTRELLRKQQAWGQELWAGLQKDAKDWWTARRWDFRRWFAGQEQAAVRWFVSSLQQLGRHAGPELEQQLGQACGATLMPGLLAIGLALLRYGRLP